MHAPLHPNLFLSSLHTISVVFMIVLLYCTYWLVFIFYGVKDVWAFGFMFLAFYPFLGRREIFIKMCVLPVCGVVKAIYNLGHVFQGSSPSRAAGLERPQNEWILTPLERS